ncbi:MAG: B12-binding domain-containing radical SAM protein [Planctomycetaceae bacterium]|nr:B12-binding domain-containing radical SAM protein [Planctomycetaceae bacterium]
MDHSLDVLFINPGARSSGYQGTAATLAAVEPPLWIGLLAENARRKGWRVDVIDAEALELSPAQAAQRAAASKPRLVAVVVFGANPSASTQKMPVAGELCRQLQSACSDTRTMLAGLHVSALPQRTMEEEAVDFVCQGEGPFTIHGVLRALTGDGDLGAVAGLWHRRDGRIVFNGPAPLIDDLDVELPAAAWDLLPMDRYRAHNWQCFDHIDRRSPYAVIYTSLGCPFRCEFCCINALFGKSGIRYRGMPGVLAEIDLLVARYGVRIIKIIDELFVLKPQRIEEFCEGLIARNYDLNIWAYARVDTVTPELLRRLRRAGVRWLAYGFESASPAVRDGVRKGFDDATVARAIEWTRQAGIHIIANYIVGLPDDDLQSMRATLDEAKRYHFEFLNLYCAMAYPGSPLYERALAEGWPLPRTWEGYSQLGVETLPLPTRRLSAGQVLQFRDEAFREYFSNPAYLRMMSEKFGPAVEAHLRQMLRHKLVRRYGATQENKAP